MQPYLWLRRILAVFVAATPLFTRAESLDEAILALMQKRNVPGLSLAVIEGGKIVKARGYGVTETGGPVTVTAGTLFQAGSVSKPVAALGALRLVDAGKLLLDEDVNRLLKTWRVPDDEPTATAKVTLRRLLSHTAGLTVHGFPGYRIESARPTLVQVLNGEKPANTQAIRVDIAPDTRWRYSGGGYTVMQQLVIDITGQSYPEFMRASVLEPLGMEASSFEQPLSQGLAGRAATGHLPGAKPVSGRWHVYPEMAAAGLWTTASDLARFGMAVQQALGGRPGAVLSPATAQLMVTPVKGDYGLGFSLAGAGATQRFSHGGRDQGFDALFTAYCQTGQGAVVMINANDNSSFMSRVMAAIAAEYRWAAYAPYAAPAPIPDDAPAVTAQVRDIFEQALAGTVDRTLFTEALAERLAAQIQDGDAARSLRAMGAFKSITLVGQRVEGARSYRYHLVFENDAIVANCTYNADGKISALDFRPE